MTERTITIVAKVEASAAIAEALAVKAELSPAVLDVIAERRRQIEVEGWTPDHDDTHVLGEMALAGAAYAGYASAHADADLVVGATAFKLWPWASSWWKPGPMRRMLVKAAALIIAEIERIDRLAAREGGVA